MSVRGLIFLHSGYRPGISRILYGVEKGYRHFIREPIRIHPLLLHLHPLLSYIYTPPALARSRLSCLALARYQPLSATCGKVSGGDFPGGFLGRARRRAPGVVPGVSPRAAPEQPRNVAL